MPRKVRSPRSSAEMSYRGVEGPRCLSVVPAGPLGWWPLPEWTGLFANWSVVSAFGSVHTCGPADAFGAGGPALDEWVTSSPVASKQEDRGPTLWVPQPLWGLGTSLYPSKPAELKGKESHGELSTTSPLPLCSSSLMSSSQLHLIVRFLPSFAHL